ncbi:MAG: protein phosphatase 2C domain-containing protein [bacterium]|nr:protein phosphatase 2C domain-containing protein [bacterium]
MAERDVMRAGTRSSRGRSRDINQDSLIYRDFRPQVDWVLAAVADGMGGHQGGEVASRLAVETLVAVVDRELTASAVPESVLPLAFDEANRRIMAAAAASPTRDGMGTTLTAALLRGPVALLGHVGDSRAYLVRGHEVSQLTQDHTLVGAMLRNGDLTEVEAMGHPQRHLITRALGGDGGDAGDFSRHLLEPGDILVLCTDGLHGLVDRGEIGELAAAKDPRRAADDLVRLAFRRGGHDDISLIIIEPWERGGPAA